MGRKPDPADGSGRETAHAADAAGPSSRPATNGPRRIKGKRTRTGCLTCRARKVKCDEAPGTCGNCERVLLHCRWPVVRNVLDERAAAHPPSVAKLEPHEQVSPSCEIALKDRALTSAGPVRRQRQAACSACRSSRNRCSQDRPVCSRCRDHGIACDYSPDRSHSVAGPSSADGSPYDGDMDTRRNGPQVHGIPRNVVEEHIEAFFTHIYPIQANAIVHRGTLLRDVADGTASRKLILAICATAARFVKPPDDTVPFPITGTPTTQRWANEAKGLLLTEDMSPDSIAAALILAKNDIHNGKASQGFVLAAVATRMALALQLHHELPADKPAAVTERETLRRLMWSCYSLDRMMSTGVPEYLAAPSLSIRLPCDDHPFVFGLTTNAPRIALESEAGVHDHEESPATFEGIGLFAHFVRLQGIRTMILRTSRNREPSDLPPWDPASRFAAAERKIKDWYSSLSPQFRLDPETIYARKFQNELTPLAMLHIWYHMNYAELTRPALPGFVESLESEISNTAPPGWIDVQREECLTHARMISGTLTHVASLVDLDTVVFGDPSLGICVYESVRIRLQNAFLLPPDAQSIELNQLTADFTVMANVLQKSGRFYASARSLLRETRRLLRRHGLDDGTVSEGSGAASPVAPDPWSRRVRTLRANHLGRPAPSYPPSSSTGSYPPPGPPFGNSPSQLYGDTSALLSWSGGVATAEPTPQGHSPEEMAILLGELNQAHNGLPLGMGNPFGDLAQWMATGYEQVPLGGAV